MSTDKSTEVVKGNEAEEFIQKIVIKVIFSTVVLVVGVGIAVYYTSGAVQSEKRYSAQNKTIFSRKQGEV